MAKCGRTACQNEASPLLVHPHSGRTYCVRCARRINEGSPGLIPWPTKAQLIALAKGGGKK